MRQTKIQIVALLLWASVSVSSIGACRVNSESLKAFSRDRIETLLDVDQLKSVYWSNEPLEASLLGRAIGVNVTSAETHFRLGTEVDGRIQNEIGRNKRNLTEAIPPQPLLHDLFVTCSVDRDRVYALTLNLEINNPFDVIDVEFEMPTSATSIGGRAQSSKSGVFRIRLSQSTFLVNLRQRIRYDECLSVNYVQLAPNVNYDIECVHCNPEQQDYLNRIFSKRMTQLDSELDSMLSQKLLLGLQVLFNQQRLELDLFLD